jgi:hypothetical protein
MAVLYFVLFHQTQLVGWIDVVLLQSVLMSLFYLLLSARLYGAPHFCLQLRELHSGVMFCLNQSSRAMQTNLDRMILRALPTPPPWAVMVRRPGIAAGLVSHAGADAYLLPAFFP